MEDEGEAYGLTAGTFIPAQSLPALAPGSCAGQARAGFVVLSGILLFFEQDFILDLWIMNVILRGDKIMFRTQQSRRTGDGPLFAVGKFLVAATVKLKVLGGA